MAAAPRSAPRWCATNLSVTDPTGLYPNDNIILVSVSDYQVNGYVGHYDGVEATDVLAFVVRIDAETGEITVSQALPIAHEVDGTTAAAHDDVATLSAGDLGGIFVSQTATDGDGDKGNCRDRKPARISFEDDGPKAIGWSYDTNTRDNDFQSGDHQRHLRHGRRRRVAGRLLQRRGLGR